MNKIILSTSLITSLVIPLYAQASEMNAVADNVLTEQRAALAENTKGKGFGPQAPRDIDTIEGDNTLDFNNAPPSS